MPESTQLYMDSLRPSLPVISNLCLHFDKLTTYWGMYMVTFSSGKILKLHKVTYLQSQCQNNRFSLQLFLVSQGVTLNCTKESDVIAVVYGTVNIPRLWTHQIAWFELAIFYESLTSFLPPSFPPLRWDQCGAEAGQHSSGSDKLEANQQPGLGPEIYTGAG